MNGVRKGFAIRSIFNLVLALKFSQVRLFAPVASGGALHKLEEMPQILTLGGGQVRKFDTNTERRAAACDDAGEDDAFDPNLPVREPKSDFHIGAGGNWRCCLHKTSTEAGIGKISPDRRRRIVHS